jgi:DNA-binding response OmpR family regulator
MAQVGHSSHPHTLRILIADPDPDTRGWYREMFALKGDLDVIDAADGREALVNALVHLPSLVITETRLPFFDGYQLCKVLRRDFQTRSVPILVVTSESRQPDLDRARNSGADSVMVKPVSPGELLAEVQRLIEHRRETGTPPTAPPTKKVKAHVRVVTTSPPQEPTALHCPTCDHALTYRHSYVGGVSERHSEQWDHFECAEGCGAYEYRRRTRKLRKVDPLDESKKRSRAASFQS